MGVDIARVKALIATLEAVTSAPHFHRTAFRTPRKTFATLDEVGHDINLMFDPDLRDFFCEQVPAAFSPVPGGWGRMGATRCDLAIVDEATLMSAVTAAHRLAAPKPRAARRRLRPAPVAHAPPTVTVPTPRSGRDPSAGQTSGRDPSVGRVAVDGPGELAGQPGE